MKITLKTQRIIGFKMDNIKCEYCGRFISGSALDKLYNGDNSEADGKMIYTMFPNPEPDRDVFWHVSCEQYNDKRIKDFMEKNNHDERGKGD